MSKENNKENIEEQQNEQKEIVFPELTLDILVGVRQLLGLSLERKTFTEEEMKTVVGVFNYFSASVEGLVHTFAKNNPEDLKKIMENYEEEVRQEEVRKEKQVLETIKEENSIPTYITNRCDADDIQG